MLLSRAEQMRTCPIHKIASLKGSRKVRRIGDFGKGGLDRRSGHGGHCRAV